MKTDRSRRRFMQLGALSAASTLFVPRDVFATYEETTESEGNDVVLRCCVMSDVHFNGNPESKETERFKRAIRFMYDYCSEQAYKNFDALVVVGDMSNHGTEPELTLFKKTMDEAVKPGTQKFLCMGNHEFYGGNQEYWQSVFGVEPNRRYEANGYRFIALSPEKGTMKDGDYLYVVDYLEKELKEAVAADPDKPIFVFQHYPVSPTVYGGRGYDDWGAEDLFDTLQKYPRVVNFSGHTHYPINDPRCAWQGCFSAFGTGTLSYICHGHEGRKFQDYLPDDGKYAQFYILEVRRDNSVTLKPYDLTTNSFFDLVYFVARPGAVADYVYTDQRYFNSARPTWREETTPTVDVKDSYSAVVEFKQAYCKDVCVGYRVDLERKNAKKPDWESAGAHYFWSEYYLRDMPETARGTISDLDGGYDYRGSITALNPFMRESDETLPVEFKTPVDPGEPDDKDAPRPNANFIDVRVVDGKVVNAPVNSWDKQLVLETHGESKIAEDAALGSVMAFADGKGYYKVPTTKEDLKKLRRATIAAKFMIDPTSTATDPTIFSSTQLGGLGLSYSAEEKKAQLWVAVNGGYVVLRAPIELGKYYEAYGTYDGKAVVFYIDGKEVARQEAVGILTHTQNDAARGFVVGGDISERGDCEAPMKGTVVYARVYTWGLKPEQVANLCKEN
ncbi:MAG: metallophosphoesterase [Thermoguttaceae bacterium]|nr:metallophosphoesterase [Thermoguttaceae bacterium]